VGTGCHEDCSIGWRRHADGPNDDICGRERHRLVATIAERSDTVDEWSDLGFESCEPGIESVEFGVGRAADNGDEHVTGWPGCAERVEGDPDLSVIGAADRGSECLQRCDPRLQRSVLCPQRGQTCQHCRIRRSSPCCTGDHVADHVDGAPVASSGRTDKNPAVTGHVTNTLFRWTSAQASPVSTATRFLSEMQYLNRVGHENLSQPCRTSHVAEP